MRALAPLLLLLSGAQAGEGVALDVRAEGFRNTDGHAIVEVYKDAESWLSQGDGVQRKVVAIPGGVVQVRFEGLPPGVYAVSVVHDENDNGAMDFRWLPPGPEEGSGVSNDAPASFGPPSFQGSRFQLGEAGGAVTLKIRY